MGAPWIPTYDWPAPITASDTVDDPAGPFAGLYITATGVLNVWPVSGPYASTGFNLTVVAGTYVYFPVKRIGVTGTSNGAALGLKGGATTGLFK